MNKVAYTLMLLLISANAWSQQIVSGEYFMDVEPGHGQGSPISFTQGDSITFTTTIAYSDLAAGFHHLNIRLKNDLGLWSLSEHRMFFIQSVVIEDATIVGAEYFIDEEPGHGNGIPVLIEDHADSVSQNFAVPFDGLVPGFHHLFFRVRDQQDQWSTTEQRNFYVMDSFPAGDIVAGEYFIDEEPGLGNGTAFTIPSASDSINSDIAFELPELAAGAHKLYVRMLSSTGKWSLNEPRIFNICETYGSVALFEIQESGNMVFFQDQSLYADSIQWNFGDTQTSSLQDPVHTYATAGVYNVSLFSMNDCATDTLTQQVIIEGVESVSPHLVSNTAIGTLTITGFGFVAGTTLKLTRAGYEDLLPISNSVLSTYTLNSLINFTGQATGLWTVEVSIPSGGTFVMEDALEINEASFATENLLMSSVQQSLSRTGRRIPATMHIQNNNPIDAIAIPVVFRDISDVQQFMITETAPLTSMPFFIDSYQYLLDNDIANTVMESNVIEGSTNSTLMGYYIPKVQALSSSDLPFFIRRNINGTHQRGSLMIYPQLNPASQLGAPIYENEICLSSFTRVAVENALAISINENEWDNCFNPWNDSLYTLLAGLASDPATARKPVSIPACITSVLIHMMQAECISNLPSVMTTEQIKGVTGHVLANLIFLNDATEVSMACPVLQGMQGTHEDVTFAGADRENEFCDLAASVGGTSMLSFGGRAAQWCALFSSSVDPNTKFGPGNNVDDIYVNPGDIAAYSITFENDSSATAPAEVVSVIDSLDAEKFNLSTFRWAPVALSDSIFIQPASDVFHQVILKDLRPALPYFLQSNFDFDTTSAVISWHFKTLDTLNLQPLDLLADGFLPPNINDNEGVGNVSFFIQYSPQLITGDSIRNNAHIVFDLNPEIITPYWNNVIDISPPASQVAALPETVETNSFNVTWGGEDAPAGIRAYTVFVSENDGPFIPWIIMVDSLSATFNGTIGNTYKFYSIAVDNADNWEPAPENPQENYDAITALVDGVLEYENDMSLSIYPVPSSDKVMCKFNLRYPSDVVLSLSDLTGKIVLLKDLKKRMGMVNEELDISELAAGVYMLQINAGAVSGNGRVIRN